MKPLDGKIIVEMIMVSIRLRISMLTNMMINILIYLMKIIIMTLLIYLMKILLMMLQVNKSVHYVQPYLTRALVTRSPICSTIPASDSLLFLLRNWLRLENP